MASLLELKVGDSAKVVGYHDGQASYRQRLLSMGLIPGTVFMVTRIAPLGDPIELQYKHFTISLRKHEGAILQIEKETHEAPEHCPTW